MVQDEVEGVDVRSSSHGWDGLVQVAAVEEVEGVGQMQIGHHCGGKNG